MSVGLHQRRQEQVPAQIHLLWQRVAGRAPHGNDDAVRDRDILDPAIRKARAAEQERVRGGATPGDPGRSGRNDQHTGLPSGRYLSGRGEITARNSERAVSPTWRSWAGFAIASRSAACLSSQDDPRLSRRASTSVLSAFPMRATSASTSEK